MYLVSSAAPKPENRTQLMRVAVLLAMIIAAPAAPHVLVNASRASDHASGASPASFILLTRLATSGSMMHIRYPAATWRPTRSEIRSISYVGSLAGDRGKNRVRKFT